MSRKQLSQESKTGLSRRDFARSATLIAAAAAVPKELSAVLSKPLQSSQSPAKLNPESEAQYQAIILKYGSRLSDEQKADIRRILGEGQKGTATLRAFPLDNADEPANMFRVTESKKR